jgi:hypothetical protein
MQEDDADTTERRVSHTDLVSKITENREAIEGLEDRIANIEALLKPVSDLYSSVQSDFDTLSRVGRFVKSSLAWVAAVLISVGVIAAWFKNGFKFPPGG